MDESPKQQLHSYNYGIHGMKKKLEAGHPTTLTVPNQDQVLQASRGSSLCVKELDGAKLASAFRQIRAFTEKLAANLSAEDCAVQSMPDASPVKWHLAHTSWFFETFILKNQPEFRQFDPQFEYLFNSYYNGVGERHCRSKRGLLSRPSLQDVYRYRQSVDEQILDFLEDPQRQLSLEQILVINTGLNHEQQHQELILTDILHLFSQNILRPAYCTNGVDKTSRTKSAALPELNFIAFPKGTYEIGANSQFFAYDNELPRHKQYVGEFQIATRAVTCGEFLAFIEDHGYEQPQFWLADGFDCARQNKWQAPLYWEKAGDRWQTMSLLGMRDVDLNEPVSHVSYYEADAFANWAGCRLPTEFEWEVAAAQLPIAGNFVEYENYRPLSAVQGASQLSDAQANLSHDSYPKQMFGDVWEWTASAYLPYPGFKTLPGALGEYNGKFMCNQMVLRGGSCATSQSHIRASYRNFFAPSVRWQFSGLRLAKDLE